MPARLSDVLLTTRDVAKRLGKHPQTIFNWRFDGRGPRFIRLGKNVFYELAAVEEWEREQAARDAK